MTGINTITKLIVTIAVIIISVISPCYPAISDKRLCYDPQCSVPVAEATTMLSYPSNDPGILSFKSNTHVRVFSKSAGNRPDLWGVEINGKRGYVPSHLLKEKKVLHPKLIHLVPTEVIVTKVQSKDSKSIESEKVNNVPIIPANIAVSSGKGDGGVEKADGIAKEASPKTAPVLDQVSPSYEIHDGTTIPFARNDEPSEPSYATQVPQGIADVGEQPILSIHPNVASTVTLKGHGDKIAGVERAEDAEKYLEAARLKKESASTKINEEIIAATTTELPSKAAKAEEIVNKESEGNLDDSTEKLEDSVPINGIEGIKITEATKETEVTSSQENVEKTTESSDEADDSEDDEEEDSEDEEEESDTPEDDVPVEGRVTTEKKNAVTEQPPAEKEAESLPVETATEAAEKIAEESMKKSAETEKIGAVESEVSVRDNNLEKNFTAEVTVEDNSGIAVQANVTDDIPVADKVDENSAVNLEAKEEPTKVDSSNAEESIPEVQGISAESKQIESEEPAEAKTEETLPSHLNIMNPLFNRLSKLPALVKEVVDNAISGGASSESSTTVEEVKVPAEPEAINSAEEISDIKQSSSSLVDFSTDINNSNDYQNDTDNSTPEVAPKSETATSSETVQIDDRDKFVNINNNSLENEKNANSTADSVETQTSQEFIPETPVQPGIYKEDELTGFRQDNFAIDDTSSFNGFPANRNLLNVGSTIQPEKRAESSAETTTTLGTPLIDQSALLETEKKPEINEEQNVVDITTESATNKYVTLSMESASSEYVTESIESTESTSVVEEITRNEGDEENHGFLHEEEESIEDDFASSIKIGRNFWETFSYVVLTAFTTLLFSLGYYYIENTRRDGQLIAKINKLEKELLVSSKECTVLDDTLKSTKSKLDSIEDESFGSNEMVVSLKADLEASKTAKSELEDQVAMLEKELESATEAGLELERMLREILSTNNADNPLAQSVEDLQTRLNAQQAANEALTNSLNLKAQENENLTSDLAVVTQKCEQLEVEVTRVTEELKHQNSVKNNMEQTMLDKVEHLEKQVKDISAERINLRKQLKGKEMEMKDLLEVVNQMNINNLDFEKLYNVSRVKAEASQLLEERDDLKIRLSEVEGAHQLLEEHVKLINEEVSSLSEQCKLAEKAKRDAETRVEVLSNFFKEKEAQRQKEEAVWLQKQGEVSSTVERLHTMQNEIHNYKQQIEMLKREILDQEREYKNQIASLETKSHEQWVIARQHERRLEESKAEAGQLRNRLTLIEKNLNDTDPEAKLHRLEANGETATSPQLFIGAEASSSPIMFTGSSGVPLPPPPSYLYGPPVPPFMPPPPHSSSGIPPYEVGQRPPPLGGRLSSPPPLHGSASSRYDNPRSPPPPLSPSMLPPYGPPHRAYPPPFANDRIHPPPPPPHSSMMPPPLGGSSHNWGDDTLPPLRNSGFQPHQQQHHREQRARNHKGSLHSSGESLDKNV